MKTLQKFQQKNPNSKLSKKACSYLKGGTTTTIKKGKKKLHGHPPPFDEN